MPTDEEHESGGPEGLARTTPRHAAPRRPLLARLHMPAGKAVALAAMPGAVLMGMGLTPTLASAKPPSPGQLFEGACAPAPDGADQPSPGASTSPTPSPGASTPSAKPEDAQKADEAEKPGEGDKAEKTETADKAGTAAKPEAAGKPSPAGTPGVAKPAPAPSAPTASPTPSAAKPGSILDPLGLGDKLHDVLSGVTGGGAKPAPAPSASPKPSTAPSASAAAPGKAKDAPKVAPTPGGSAGPGVVPKPSGSPSPSASPSASASASPSPSPSASGSPGELPPCPKGTVVDENEHRAFPNQPWYLEASKLTLHGLTYEGVKRIRTVNGEQKSVLKFTADMLEIQDLHQIVNSQGRQYHVTGKGTNSTVSGGRITMYTEELKGNLLGLIPSTQSPTSVPPLIPGLKLPIPIFFTNVKIRQAGQFGGTLHIPNLHQYLTEGTYP
ncbi:hypothetical protein BLA24_24190 [Streptomyces cinnamoneus]|uniref:Hydrogenase expression protein HypF n=1 Tax=Streptomyces cinnamoneus TaxID=53446 RepID=A0A2G1XDC1_STRCJ|nr:hypothetical protein [Streptomyces cinnamoneus]PHQ49169.1 hypothetical protein BLA24_24190 [Streptomyces cinnamoneus]PPT15181.1 hypothetical protein CYQ11_21885 [Streptomyces cinnamoneus]